MNNLIKLLYRINKTLYVTVSLDRRYVFSIQKQVDIGQVWWWSAVNDHFVEHQQIGRRLFFVLVLPDNYAPESTAQRQCCMPFEHVGHLLLEIVKLERCQKTQWTQVKCHDRRYRLLKNGTHDFGLRNFQFQRLTRWYLKQKTSVQQSAVSAQTNDKVYFVRQIVFAVLERL